MRAGFVQINSRLLDVEGNIDKALRLIGNKKADLIVIPELFNTGYNFRTQAEVEKVAEPIPTGTTTEALKDLSKRWSHRSSWNGGTKGSEPVQFCGNLEGWEILGNLS